MARASGLRNSRRKTQRHDVHATHANISPKAIHTGRCLTVPHSHTWDGTRDGDYRWAVSDMAMSRSRSTPTPLAGDLAHGNCVLIAALASTVRPKCIYSADGLISFQLLTNSGEP